MKSIIIEKVIPQQYKIICKMTQSVPLCLSATITIFFFYVRQVLE